MHSPHAEDWTLRIRYAQRKDSGIYECQISTTPPIGHSVYLNIVEPVTEIVGGPELHINKGSTINLTCIVKFAPEPPPTVVWSHNRQVINFDSPRGGISLVTEKGILTTSRLLVQKAVQSDSGLYTCTPSNANPISVRVHIVDGEHPAAMHHGAAHKIQMPPYQMMAIFLFILLWLHQQNRQRQCIRWRRGTIKLQQYPKERIKAVNESVTAAKLTLLQLQKQDYYKAEDKQQQQQQRYYCFEQRKSLYSCLRTMWQQRQQQQQHQQSKLANLQLPNT